MGNLRRMAAVIAVGFISVGVASPASALEPSLVRAGIKHAAAAPTTPIMVAAFDETIRPGCFDYQNLFYTLNGPLGPLPAQASVVVYQGIKTINIAQIPVGTTTGTLPDVLCDTSVSPGTYSVYGRDEPGDGVTEYYSLETSFRFRRATFTTIAGPKAALPGRTMTLTGRLVYLKGTTWLPASTHETIYFRHYSTSPWTPIGTVATSTSGTYAFRYASQVSGCYRTVFPGSDMDAPSSATTCVPVV